MGLLVLACIAAMVLVLLMLVTIAIVQLVLYVTVRNTLALLAAVGVYWYVDSRRRQVAKGFYSCKELPAEDPTATPPTPPQATTTATAATATSTQPSAVAESRKEEPGTGQVELLAAATDAIQSNTDAQETKREAPIRRNLRQRSHSEETRSTFASPRLQALQASDECEAEMRHSLSSLSDVEARRDVVDVAAMDTGATPPTTTNMRLPYLRRKNKWKAPSHSLPLKTKGEVLLLRRTGSSASSSPRRPELYGSPRSVAMEQKLMKSALESDGYWIGDFRHPQPTLPRRQTHHQLSSTGSGASTPTKTRPASSTSFTSSTASTASTST